MRLGVLLALAACTSERPTDTTDPDTNVSEDAVFIELDAPFRGARLKADGDVILVCEDDERSCSAEVDPPGAAEFTLEGENWLCLPQFDTVSDPGTYEMEWDGDDGDYSDWDPAECGLRLGGRYCNSTTGSCEDFETVIDNGELVVEGYNSRITTAGHHIYGVTSSGTVITGYIEDDVRQFTQWSDSSSGHHEYVWVLQ